MEDKQIIDADWTWTGDRFERDVQVIVGADGHIDHVGTLDVRPTHRLDGQALLPGMINVHSHAFQRGLRGHGETFPAGSIRLEGASDFWTWREEMYRLVDRMEAETLYDLSRGAFSEMLASGITTVGEFHYLHHDATCDGYGFDEIILKAAHDAGIRLVLLNAYYNTGGIDQPPSGPQRRFATASVEAYWRQMDRLAAQCATASSSATPVLGVVAHSIRAAGIDDIVSLHQQSAKRGMVFHMHVEEQQREVEDCIAAYGKTPMALLNERLAISDSFTAIHCTHTAAADMERFTAAGGNVCICPLTEANLGDGIADVPSIRAAGGRICVGTDSNARICMTEELRWLEYGQRLKTETRGLCADKTGSVAKALWEMATVNGARSLGLRAGRIEAGHLADFVTIDLTAPSFRGWTPETLLDAFIFGTGTEAIASTCVGGQWTQPLSRT